MTDGPRQHQPGGLLWHRDFRLLWGGETVSWLGNYMAIVALPLLAVDLLHASNFAVGLLVAAGYLPWLVIGLPAGAWVDQLPTRRVMVTCDLISAALFASVPLTAWAGVLTIGQLLTVALLAGTATVSSAPPIRSTSVPCLLRLPWWRAMPNSRAAKPLPSWPGPAWLASWHRRWGPRRRCWLTR